MVKVAIAGAAGGIGQPLSLLCKLSPYISELSLYDVRMSVGVATDLSHIHTKAKVTGFLPDNDGMQKAFSGSDLVIIPAGIPRKPGMTRDALFNINAGIVRDLVTGVAKYAPKAFILIISNPVNSNVPIAAEILKKYGVFDPKRLFGVTTLDVVRSETFIAQIANPSQPDPSKFNALVVGGHSGETIVPLISATAPEIYSELVKNSEELAALIKHIQFAGDDVVKAKDGAGSATLSMAYAGFKFANSILKAISGEKNIIEPTYVHLEGIEGGKEVAAKLGVKYFTLPVELGPEGAHYIKNVLNNVSKQEEKLLEIALDNLRPNIEKGEKFILDPPAPKSKL